MQSLTKIIATIGPASDSEEAIKNLINLGVNIFRFNFKHSDFAWHNERILKVNKIAEKLNKNIGTLIDLQGPEIRINMSLEYIDLKENEEIVFGKNSFIQNKKGFSITHPDIIKFLKNNQIIYADDGFFSFRVVKKSSEVFLISNTNGRLYNKKSINIPGANFPFPVLIERDFEGLKLASANNIDYIALSMVRNANDLKTVKKEAGKHNVKSKFIAKIENQKAIDNLDSIIHEVDGIMIARGDLGVEIPIEEVPYYQKSIINKCISSNKFVITATQMLNSMIENPMPTRAEVSDVANAVYDKTDCVMLSGETANGRYPEKAVNMMKKTVIFYELKTDNTKPTTTAKKVEDTTSFICEAAYNMYLDYQNSAKKMSGFIVFSQTGKTAEILSTLRPKMPIYAFVPTKKICEGLSSYFAVMPILFKFNSNNQVTLEEINDGLKILKNLVKIGKDHNFIVIHGDKWGTGTGATTLRII